MTTAMHDIEHTPTPPHPKRVHVTETQRSKVFLKASRKRSKRLPIPKQHVAVASLHVFRVRSVAALLYLGVVHLTLELFVLGDLPYRLHEVLLRDRQSAIVTANVIVRLFQATTVPVSINSIILYIRTPIPPGRKR